MTRLWSEWLSQKVGHQSQSTTWICFQEHWPFWARTWWLIWAAWETGDQVDRNCRRSRCFRSVWPPPPRCCDTDPGGPPRSPYTGSTDSSTRSATHDGENNVNQLVKTFETCCRRCSGCRGGCSVQVLWGQCSILYDKLGLSELRWHFKGTFHPRRIRTSRLTCSAVCQSRFFWLGLSSFGGIGCGDVSNLSKL